MSTEKAPDAQGERLPSLRDALTIIFKHKYGGVTLFLLIVAVVTVATYVLPLTYEGSSKILVKFDRENIPMSTASSQGRAMLTMRSTEEDMRTEMEIMRDSKLLGGVVKKLKADLTAVPDEELDTNWQKFKHQVRTTTGEVIKYAKDIGYRLDLFRELSEEDALLRNLQKNLNIDIIGDSNVIQVAYTSSRPDLCEKVVNAITDAYLDRHIEVHRSPQALGFFEEQMRFFKLDLESKELELKDFKQESSISSIELQRSLYLNDISALMVTNNALQRDIAEGEGKVKKLREEITRRTNYKDVEAISPVLLTTDPVYRSLENERALKESELEGLKAKSGLQEEQQEYYETRMKALDEKEMKLARLEREQDILEENYKKYFARAEDARISEKLDEKNISNVTIIEDAVVPFEPIRLIGFLPTRILHICMGLLAGLLVALGYAFLSEQFDHTFNSSEQMERILGVSCVAVIPRR